MRWIHVGMLVVAACGGSDDGVLLVVDAPDGATARRLEIVLASAAEDAVAEVPRQRVEPADLATEPARYYKQRAITGAVDGVGTLDGFALRLEPNIASIPDEQLIPFLIAYDDQNHVSGIGAVLDDNGEPRFVEIIPDQLIRFDVSMVVVSETDGAEGVGVNQMMVVDCPSFTRSGIAWQTGTLRENLQLRLLMPDRSQDPDATDASERKLDMDCDNHKALVDDCDDLRSAFHDGAVETCDGLDTDCDSRTLELVTCDTPNATCDEPGIAVCAEENSSTEACLPTPECACEVGSCAECVISFSGGDGAPATPCSPSIEPALQVPCEQGGGCDVEVLPRPGDVFRAEIALPGGAFGSKVSGVVDGKVSLKVETNETLAAVAGDRVGGVFLAVTTNGQTRQISFAIKLGQETVCPVTDAATMICVGP